MREDAGPGTMSGEQEPIPLSALQHAVYCLRQAALIHLERLWEENRFTAEGHVLHVASDKLGGRRVRGVRRVTALVIGSPRLGIAGVADLVEFHEDGGGEVPFPVEYKRGKPKLHRADEVQLCAQALCLEDMTGKAVPAGALFYAETKRRVDVAFGHERDDGCDQCVAELAGDGLARPSQDVVVLAGRQIGAILFDAAGWNDDGRLPRLERIADFHPRKLFDKDLYVHFTADHPSVVRFLRGRCEGDFSLD